jgi:hypothetical protein
MSPFSFEHNLRQLVGASQTIWPRIVVGPKPPVSWFGRVGHGPKDSGCTVCIVHRCMNVPATTGCAKREGNFHVAADEPQPERIRVGSCRLCWETYRRPCVWTPSQFGRDPSQPWDAQRITLPPGYEGVAAVHRYSGPAVEIQPPMSIELYSNAKEEVKELETMDLDASRELKIEDDCDK